MVDLLSAETEILDEKEQGPGWTLSLVELKQMTGFDQEEIDENRVVDSARLVMKDL